MRVSMRLKTKILDKFRMVGMLPPVEGVLVWLAFNKTAGNFFAKAAPNNYQYPKGTMRVCERNGIRYALDISDYMQYCIYFGIKIEPREVLYDLVENQTTVIDVGTNIGETLLNFAKLNHDGLNIGFEPVPYLFDAASRNISLNNFPNVRLENLALSDMQADLVYNIVNDNNSGGIYLSTSSEAVNSTRKVAVTTLDEYVSTNNLENISLLKIDVEGFEIKVLKGACKTIENFKPAIFVEVDNTFLKRQNGSAAELAALLESYGYDLVNAETGEPVSSGQNFEGRHFDAICRHDSRKANSNF